MLFNSVQFMIFLPAVAVLYFTLPHRFRWILLLAASYFFYACWKIEYIILILLTTAISFFACRLMGTNGSDKRRRALMVAGIGANLGILMLFKYYNFFRLSLSSFAASRGFSIELPDLDILNPIGISFYTFQVISYIADVYNRKKEPEKHFGIYSLYVSFFPQLVAGPIERSTHLLPQFHAKNSYDPARTNSGILLILFGLFKKVVVGDNMALLVDSVYASPADHTGLQFAMAAVFFSFQIYFDFSGYSDIAIGAARILGYDLMKNFDSPYFSKSIPEFWQRWHISLSTWFRDYLYIPLGGNRVSNLRWWFNIMMVFALSGLWHGANWTFIFWGSLHGLLYLFYTKTQKIREGISAATRLDKAPILKDFISIAITFSLVTILWIFFRSDNISNAFFIIGRIFSLPGSFLAGGGFSMIDGAMVGTGMSRIDLILVIVLTAMAEIIGLIDRRHDIWNSLASGSIIARWSAFYILIFMILLLGRFEKQPFIYFQF